MWWRTHDLYCTQKCESAIWTMRLGLAQIILVSKMSWKLVLLEPICILHFLHPKASRLIRCGRVLPGFMMKTGWQVYDCVFASVCLSVCVSISLISSIPESKPIPSHSIIDWGVSYLCYFFTICFGNVQQQLHLCPQCSCRSMRMLILTYPDICCD